MEAETGRLTPGSGNLTVVIRGVAAGGAEGRRESTTGPRPRQAEADVHTAPPGPRAPCAVTVNWERMVKHISNAG
jgi:hypothetical protein